MLQQPSAAMTGSAATASPLRAGRIISLRSTETGAMASWREERPVLKTATRLPRSGPGCGGWPSLMLASFSGV